MVDWKREHSICALRSVVADFREFLLRFFPVFSAETSRSRVVPPAFMENSTIYVSELRYSRPHFLG